MGMATTNLNFLRYERVGEGRFTLLNANPTIERFKQAADHMKQYVSQVVRLLARIYREKNLKLKLEGL